MKSLKEFKSSLTISDYLKSIVDILLIFLTFTYIALRGNCIYATICFGFLSIICMLLAVLIMIMNKVSPLKLYKNFKNKEQ